MNEIEPSDRLPLQREMVVAAARAMIVADGLDQLSLRRVAASLGVTAPALYAHVEGKRDLLRAVAESAFGELGALFAHIEDTDPLDRLRRLSRIYVEYAVANPELFRTMFLFPPDLQMARPTGEELPAATRVFELSLAVVIEAVESGTLRPIDPLMAALTLWTATHGVADVLLMGFDFDETGRDELLTSVLDAVIAGLRA